MKKTILVSLCAFVIVLAGCTPTAPTGRQNANIPPTNTIQPVEKPQSALIYTDPIYKFTLELPAAWAGYVTKRKSFEVGGSAVYFGFAAWDDIFAISIAPVYEANPANAKYLGTDGKNYFYAGSSQYIKVAALEARRNEFSQIASSFKLPNL